MNGYTVMAENYKKAIEQGKIAREVAEPEIRILDFLSTCSKDDIYRLINSSAFNDIMKAYMNKAVKNANLKNDDAEKVLYELKCLFDEKSASEICEE